MSLVEHRLFCQFGFFCSHDVVPRPKTIAKIITELGEFDFLPSTVQAIQLGPEPEPTQALHLQLFTQDKQWTVDFEPHRFLIQRNAVTSEESRYADDFAPRTIRILRRLNDLYSGSATRLSFVTKGLCGEMSKNELNHAHKNLFSLPVLFHESDPVEWSMRQVIRREEPVNGKSEQLNVVADLSRIQGEIVNEPNSPRIDRIQIGMDINTLHEKQEQRFTPDDVGSFIEAAMRNTHAFEKDIEKLIHVSP